MKKFIGLILSAAMLVGLGSDRASLVQAEIEKEIKGILSEQLGGGEYYVYAVVRGAEDKKKPAGLLPFTSLNVSKGILQEILEKNFAQEEIKSLRIEVNIGFDNRIPAPKRTLLEDVIRKRFGFDGTTRILNVQSVELVSERIAMSERFELEKARMESAQERLKLENERAKLELQLKEIELAKMKEADTLNVNDKDEMTDGKSEVAAANGPVVPGETVEADVPSAEFSLFKDVQLTVVGLILGFLILAAAVVGGSFFRSGLSRLSDSIGVVGNSIESAAKTSAPTTTSVTLAGEDGAGGGEKEGGGVREGGPIQVVDGAIGVPNEEFLKQVQDKLEVLVRDRNFNFFRVFADMIGDRNTLAMAAAVMVSLEEDIAKMVVKNVSIEDITKLKSFLAGEGGLVKAKELRAQALTEFYGRIAMDEFTGSPLMELRDLLWLTRMSTREMSAFVLGLTEDERPPFLACLSPSRTRKILDSLNNDKDKDRVLRSLAAIDSVTEEKVRGVMTEIARRMAGVQAQKSDDPKYAVDGARYLAAVAEELSEAEQARLFNVIGSKENLVESIREHYIPFRMISVLPKELVMEIFAERPDGQIAQIIFDASPEIRNLVINALPEIRAESVRDELRVLDDDNFYRKRNRKVSAKLQKEVSKYLLRLYSEGLISFAGSDTRAANLRAVETAA